MLHALKRNLLNSDCLPLNPPATLPLMKALILQKTGAPPIRTLADIPAPVAIPGEVLLRVRACGVNRLDLWAASGSLPVRVPTPLIQGCEIAGEILHVPSSSSDWTVGNRVAVQSNLYCGRCEFCLRGEESTCLDSILLGVQRNGGFAEQVAVPVSSLVRLPDDVSFDSSAALTLAGSTAVHMLTNRTTVAPAMTVLVIAAASGVGSAAIQIARHLGARVITTGSTATKRQLGLALGAEAAVDSSEPGWSKEVRRLTGKRGVDLIVEHVGGDVLPECFHCLARGGTIVTCGATAGKTVPLDLWPLFVKEQKLVGSYGRTRADMELTLKLASAGHLRPVIDRTYPLAEATDAFERLSRREALGKLVIRIP